MKRFRFHNLVLGLGLITGITVVHAETIMATEAVESPPVQTVLSLHAPQADWTFSGTVSNESGERYHYFFQLKRNATQYQGIATIIDGQSKAVLVHETGKAIIEHAELSNWRVGNLFLRFNPVNSSWIFGVSGKGKKGFNFKVDMLEHSDMQLAKKQNLRDGIELLINQTGRLNGHLQAGDTSKEEFITAKKSWFRQIWTSKAQNAQHPLTALLCEFNDGKAVYSVTIPEQDTIRGSVAGWRDEKGTAVAMSQFVTVTEAKDNIWKISISSPKTSLSFTNLLGKDNDNHSLIMGVIDSGLPGFCAISKDEIEVTKTAPLSS